MLVQRLPRESRQHAHSVFVILRPASDGRAYEVQSGGIFRATYPAGGGRNLLWQGERAELTNDGTDSRTPIANPLGDEAGTKDASARGQSNLNVRSPAVRGKTNPRH